VVISSRAHRLAGPAAIGLVVYVAGCYRIAARI
jgi:hypothetical protein